MESPIYAIRAARRLSTMSTVVLTVYSVVALLGAAGSTALLITADNRDDRTYAGILIGSTIMSWLMIALLCFAADAIARHIEYQAD